MTRTYSEERFTEEEHRFTGPCGRFHLTWSTGCYTGRPSECCPVCLARLLVFPVRRWLGGIDA